MTKRADFYLLSTASDQERWRYACQVLEKAYQHGLSVYVLTASPSEAEALNTLLWEFKPDSFIPHVLANDSVEAPIRIGHTMPASLTCDAVMNLSDQPITGLESITRAFEVVSHATESVAAARQRFKLYRSHGFTLNTHKIGSS